MVIKRGQYLTETSEIAEPKPPIILCSSALTIFEFVKDFPAYDQLSVAESAMLRYAMVAEMTLTPSDYLMRRTNHILFQRDRLDAIKHPVVDAMAAYYDWSQDEKAEQLVELNQVINASDLKDLKVGAN